MAHHLALEHGRILGTFLVAFSLLIARASVNQKVQRLVRCSVKLALTFKIEQISGADCLMIRQTA